MILDTIFTIFRPIAIILVVILVGVCIMTFFFQDRFIFPVVVNKIKYPEDNPDPFKSPLQMGLKFKNLMLKTSDGVILQGWLVFKPRTTPAVTLLYFHENAGNIGLRMFFIHYVVEVLNMNVIIFGYRGYGRSEGKPSESGLYLDGLSISSYIFENKDISDVVDKTKIILFGRGIGGAVAAYVGSHGNFPFSGMILENTFTSLVDIANIMFPFLTGLSRYLLRSKFETNLNMGKIEMPILFLRGEKDNVVPKVQMEILFLLAKNSIYKDFYEVKNGTHNDGYKEDKDGYKNVIKKFVDICISKKYDEKPGKTLEEIYEDFLKERNINFNYNNNKEKKEEKVKKENEDINNTKNTKIKKE